MRTFLVLLTIYICCSLNVNAQTKNPPGKITISVKDNTGKPLAFANVLLRQVKDSALVKGELTAENGEAGFELVPPGHYFIQASQMGYTTRYAAPFKIEPGHTNITLPALSLEAVSKNLQAVNVTAIKPYAERTAGKTVLNVENSVTAAGNTALDILKRAPGVQTDNSENIKLKGQSVTVMIDGRLTYLSGEELTNLLKNTPGETISQIEILTNPSSSYDAAGNGGIINIKTKKGRMTGINGSVNATLSQARYGTYNAGGNFNWRTTKFNVFGDFNKGDRPFQVTREYRRTITDTIQTTRLEQDIFQRNHFKRNAYKIGTDYFINDKQTLGILVNGYSNSFSNQVFSETRLGKPEQKPDSILHSYTRNNNHFDNIAVNLNYKAVLDTGGREISVDADFARFNNNRHLLVNDSFYNVHANAYHSPNGIQNTGSTQITIKSIKADLAWPLGREGKLEAGVKASLVSTQNVLMYDSLLNGTYKHAATQSDEFDYQEDVYAAYASYKKQVNKTGIQLGLRVENTHSNGRSVTMGSEVKRNYLDFFPNLNLDHKLNEKNKLGLSYSRRLQRPEYGQLNPFMYYLDRYTYGKGNPYLKPQYTNNFELSYTYLDKFILSVGASRTKDMIDEFITQDNNTKASISTEINYDRGNIYTLALTLPFQVTKWWSSDNNFNLASNNYSFNDNQGIQQHTSSTTYTLNTTNTITLPRDLKVEVLAYYNSPFVYAIFRGYSEYNINAGIQKTFLDKAATIKFSVNNILRNEAYRGVAQYSNLDMKINNIWEFKTYSLYFSYRFGNSSIKAARERKTGTSDEAKRAG